jgi:hypothetical protein
MIDLEMNFYKVSSNVCTVYYYIYTFPKYIVRNERYHIQYSKLYVSIYCVTVPHIYCDTSKRWHTVTENYTVCIYATVLITAGF